MPDGVRALEVSEWRGRGAVQGGALRSGATLFARRQHRSNVTNTPCFAHRSLDLVGFRRIQSCLAMEALENSYRSAQRTLSGLTKEEVRWRHSVLVCFFL